MGSIIGSVVGGLFGRKSGRDAANTANQGFNYLLGNENVQQAQEGGLTAQNFMEQLLGLRGGNAAETAFDRFREGTGYQFMMDEGIGAIENSMAARGVLNSGATSKALMKYGQNLASQSFGDYMSRLGGMAGTGLETALNVGGAGTSSGQTAAEMRRSGDQDLASGVGGLLSGIFG